MAFDPQKNYEKSLKSVGYKKLHKMTAKDYADLGFVSDIGHDRIYTTDRLGTPRIETVTYPDLLTPQEAAEAGHYIRFVSRSTGKVNVGNGAGRQDVNVSITGGTQVEIKGVSVSVRFQSSPTSRPFAKRRF